MDDATERARPAASGEGRVLHGRRVIPWSYPARAEG
ncbi:hypothetical protein M768_07695 [Cellulosimicrobium cellulans F16]|uniref:Uncharacterized protein n=1 Tax=Cellulosimicrobium cellulans F16 TaxID=1350482 RepID=A0A0M0F9Z0_CELCE|nr:hypothetical protein M768_07695 [Cellulosimicrobium cellulans F16]